METTTLTIGEIEQVLLRSPMGRELLQARQREEERKALVAEIAALRKEQEQELPLLRRAKDEAWQAALDAHKTFKTLEAHARGKESTYSAVSSRLAHWISRDENALRQSANPIIGEFIKKCHAAITTARGSFSSITVPTGDLGFESGRPIVEQKSNADIIERDVKILEAAIKGAEELKLLALTDNEVEMRLQKLSEMLPADAKQHALILDAPHEYALVIKERSELVRLSQTVKDIKRGIRESLGIGSVRPLRQ